MKRPFWRTKPETPAEADRLKLRLLRQQIEATETNYILGQITDKEHDSIIRRCSEELSALEDKYGISDVKR